MIILSNMPMIIFVIVLIIILYLSFVLSIVIFVEKSRFNKRIEVNDYIEEQDYSKFEGLIRNDFSFYSNNNKLNGYIFNYENINNNKKIIFVNGYNTTTETNIVEINYLASLGYTVYCYDNTGVGKSEGKKFNGCPQSLIDLQNCIKHLRKDNRDEPLILVGHSMGGNAVINILNLEKIDKVVAISPYNNITDVVSENVKEKVGKKIFLFKTMHKLYLRIKFKKYASFNAYDTLKYTNSKVLVIHGINDKTVKVDDCYDFAMNNLNNNVKCLIVENKGHRPLLSINAINYNMFLDHSITELKLKFGKQIPEKELQVLRNNVNYKLKEELDEEIIREIKDFLCEV